MKKEYKSKTGEREVKLAEGEKNHRISSLPHSSADQGAVAQLTLVELLGPDGRGWILGFFFLLPLTSLTTLAFTRLTVINFNYQYKSSNDLKLW